jgi:8-oxo-dGTP diphosphatase
MDQFDVVRCYYQAINEGAIDVAASLYDEQCVTDNAFIDEESAGHSRGRQEARRRLRDFFETYAGAMEGGGYFDVRTIGGIGTGWGWVQADWTLHARHRENGSERRRRGSTHFLIEDALIRRVRSVSTEVELPTAAIEPAPRSDRHYPARPVVGVGAVIVAFDDDCGVFAGVPPMTDGPRVVLIKRKFEPLAGQWSLPGGTLELGETLEAGVAREIKEETGLAVRVGAVVDVFDRILFDPDGRVRYHFVLVDYLCRPCGGTLCAASDVSDVALVNPADLAPFALTVKAQVVIAKAVEMAAAQRA